LSNRRKITEVEHFGLNSAPEHCIEYSKLPHKSAKAST
jgi:hypothetical protein